MCGIIGFFNKENANKLAIKAIDILNNRGQDGYGVTDSNIIQINNTEINPSKDILAHRLHSVVGHIPQPLKSKKGVISANCEIYNWKELTEKYKIRADNDAHLLAQWLDLNHDQIAKKIDELDGPYAFAYWYNKSNKLILARDLLGIKPIWYSHSDGFSFASEKKALEKQGIQDVIELNPRLILKYDIKKDSLEFINRPFYESKVLNYSDPIQKTQELLKKAVIKRIPDVPFGLLLSGGVDSTVLAYILKQMKVNFTCYTAVIDDPDLAEPADLKFAKLVAEKLNIKHKIIRITPKQLEKSLKLIIPLIEDSNVVKAGVAATFHHALKQAHKDGIKVIMSGLGSEEIFAGYKRHKDSIDVNKECIAGLRAMYERDLYRDDVVSMYNQIELRLPFLDRELVKYALTLSPELKINEGMEKYILRCAAERMEIPRELAMRKKQAAQYGSKVHRSLQKLAKKKGYKLVSEYLKQFLPEKNLRLGAMISGGKDSLYAAYIMKKQNYDIACFITIKSSNQYSYMFHTPNIDMVELQAESAGVPLISACTDGEKETELEDLRNVLKKAKKQYKLDGIITGAIFSTYQRDRVQKICDEIGLKTFVPLWHKNQKTLMQELIQNNFKFVLSSIAAEGINHNMLGKPFTMEMLHELDKARIGLNHAGEGGEYESLVIDCPLFEQAITIKKSKIITESKTNAFFVVERN